MQSSVSSVELEEHSVGMSFIELIPDSQMVEPDDFRPSQFCDFKSLSL